PRLESFAGRPLKVVSALRNVARTALLVYYTALLIWCKSWALYGDAIRV
ncbi:MAG: hypothetical protein ACI9VX_002523, partial [Dinoroseobacter sp.]